VPPEPSTATAAGGTDGDGWCGRRGGAGGSISLGGPLRPLIEPTLQLLSEVGDWLPHVDLCEGRNAFVVVVDVPSLTARDLNISRSGAHTRVRGGRTPPFSEGAVELRGERLFGRWALSVRVPDTYEKRLSEAKLTDGVLRLTYKADIDDEDEAVPVSAS
jgi:HSP20 family protein